MPIHVNLRHLEAHEVELEGEVSVAELDIETRDEIIRVVHPLDYAICVERIDGGVLATGRLQLKLECECVRCLKEFQYPLEIQDWSAHLPLEGEEAVPVVNDCIDLTPYVREDILLEFPQHPLCNQECRGLPRASVGEPEKSTSSDQSELGSSPWAELNKLKF